MYVECCELTRADLVILPITGITVFGVIVVDGVLVQSTLLLLLVDADRLAGRFATTRRHTGSLTELVTGYGRQDRAGDVQTVQHIVDGETLRGLNPDKIH